jgi:hypothetical protein
MKVLGITPKQRASIATCFLENQRRKRSGKSRREHTGLPISTGEAMTQQERQEFIKQHIDKIKNDIYGRANRMPDEWDGLELKQYIADSFSISKHWWTSARRKREFENTVVILGL